MPSNFLRTFPLKILEIKILSSSTTSEQFHATQLSLYLTLNDQYGNNWQEMTWSTRSAIFFLQMFSSKILEVKVLSYPSTSEHIHDTQSLCLTLLSNTSSDLTSTKILTKNEEAQAVAKTRQHQILDQRMQHNPAITI